METIDNLLTSFLLQLAIKYFFRYLCLSYAKEGDYTINVEVFNILEVQAFNVTAHVEKPIKSVAVDITPSLTSSIATEIFFEFEKHFTKGNLDLNFGDNKFYSEWLSFGDVFPTTTVKHR